MRTVLVNPSRSNPMLYAANRRRKKRRGRKRANTAITRANPRILVVQARRTRRRSSRRRRHNPMLMNSNPLILPNRRRRRRNAAVDFTKLFTEVAWSMGAGAASYGLNRVGISKIGVTDGVDSPMGVWIRNAIRLGLGGLAAYLWPGPIGYGAAGAMGSTITHETSEWWIHAGPGSSRADAGDAGAGGPTDTGADLEDFGDVLDDLYG